MYFILYTSCSFLGLICTCTQHFLGTNTRPALIFISGVLISIVVTSSVFTFVVFLSVIIMLVIQI